MKRIILTLILLLGIANVVTAIDSYDDLGNPNDPAVNERANACFIGATLEGKCDSPLMWEAGWYLIRFEYEVFAAENIPEWVAWVLPPEVRPQELANVGSEPCIITITAFGASATTRVPGSILSGKSGLNNSVSAGGFTFVWSSDGPLRAGGKVGDKYWYGNIGSNGSWASAVDASECPATPSAPIS